MFYFLVLNLCLLIFSKSVKSLQNQIETIEDDKHGIIMGKKIDGCDDGQVRKMKLIFFACFFILLLTNFIRNFFRVILK